MEIDRQEFIEWMGLKELSPITIKDYMFYYDKVERPQDLNQENVIEFLTHYNNVVARGFITNLIKFLVQHTHDVIRKGEINSIELPKKTGRAKKRLPKVITDEQVKLIAEGMSNERNKIMTLLSFYCALRVSELLNIKPYDFKWERWWRDKEKNGKLHVIGKGNKERVVFVVPKLMKEIEEWVKTVAIDQDKDAPLFGIGVRRWQTILTKASQKALGFSIHPHLLRASCATFLHRCGWNMMDLKEYLGHENISTTQIYIDVDKEALDTKFLKAFMK